MACKLKWRVEGAGPLTPETFNTEDQARARARDLLALHRQSVTIDVWNEDETWQIITPAGIAQWCVGTVA
jgi:hypothetical protein